MAQFDVHENTNIDTVATIPYLLNVQADLLNNLTTRVVVPLVTASAMGKPAIHLNPRFEIEGKAVVMSTAELAGVNVNVLGAKIGSLDKQRDEIIAALDFLFTGF
jgi:toxin CcdB